MTNKKFTWIASIICITSLCIPVATNYALAGKKRQFIRTDSVVGACSTLVNIGSSTYDPNLNGGEVYTPINYACNGSAGGIGCSVVQVCTLSCSNPDGTWTELFNSCRNVSMPCGYFGTNTPNVTDMNNLGVGFFCWEIHIYYGTCSNLGTLIDYSLYFFTNAQ